LIFIERKRLGDAEVGEGEAGLLLQKRYPGNRRSTIGSRKKAPREDVRIS
jgi:hypothetical protein